MTARSELDRVLDEAVLLATLRLADADLDRTCLYKTLFKAELDLRHQGGPSPSYAFFRWHFGPFSKELADDVDLLKARGLLATSRSRPVRLTVRGRRVADFIHNKFGVVDDWREVQQAIAASWRFTRSRSASELEQWSHDLRLVPDGSTEVEQVHLMPLKRDILVPRARPDWQRIAVGADLLDVVAANLSRSERDLAEMRELQGPFETLDDLFAALDAEPAR